MTRSAVFLARGMHCHGCEHIIESMAHRLPGVRRIKADYPTETVTVDFDPALTSLDDIRAAIERTGYSTRLLDDPSLRRGRLPNVLGLLLAVAGLLLIIFFDTEWISQGGTPDISQRMSLGLIFVLGLLTGFHCVGMCGGFVLSYTANDARMGRRSYLSHLLYATGKTLSYAVIGAAFGLLGAFVAFTPLLRGAAGIIAGLFLILFGLNMLGLFAPLRRFRFGLPAPLQAFVYKESHRRHQPFVIGLLNGLMIACGPLQAMYVMAAGTGSALEGAKMLFVYGLGTLPVLMSFGVLTTFISGALTYRLLRVSGVIVVVLGAVMINRGLILTGIGYDLRSIINTVSRVVGPTPRPTPDALPAPSPQAQQERPAPTPSPQAPRAQTPLPASQLIKMDVTRSGFSPTHFVLIKGVPVKWVIVGKQITACNKRIVVPNLNLEFDVKKGRQTIEFTPDKVGTIPWSCWMGMLHGEFEVVEPPALSEREADVGGKPSKGPSEEATPSKRYSSASAHTEVYTIASGDTLSTIAARLYNDSRRWTDIAAANPGIDLRRLRPGQTIKLPTPVVGNEGDQR
jgi:sulfite exporter TauE/SafE/copper chaperone CopZ